MSADLKTLDELMGSADAAETPIKVFVGNNLGNRTFHFEMPMYDFFNRSEVANDREASEEYAQRRLDPTHARKLAVFILRGLVSAAIRQREMRGKPVPPAFTRVMNVLGSQPYCAVQPIVANLRTCERDGRGMRGRLREARDTGEALCFEFYLALKDVLYIIDGQHRRWAMELVFQFLKDVQLNGKYPKRSLYPAETTDVPENEMDVWLECKELSRQFTVSIELHLGLSVAEERQLFHDLNNLGKRVEAGLSFEFDNSNPVNAFIKEELLGTGIVKVVEKDIVNWNDDTGAIARKNLVAVNAHLFLNKSNITGAIPSKVDPKKEVARQFWHAVTAIPGFGEPGAKATTVAAQPVVMKALAKLTYDFAFDKHPNPGLLQQLFDGMTDGDDLFSHENPMWRYFEMNDKERRLNGLSGLSDYLPKTQGNRDIGQFQDGVMRFGAKHNDIYPIIGDMIRWRLGLPSRHEGASIEIPEAVV
jgi:hypothetical protein